MRWRRLIILLTSALLLAAVTVELTWFLHQRKIRVANALVRNPPWLMWGGSNYVDHIVANTGDSEVLTGQMVRIAYKRPESWRFLFGATLIETTATSGNIDVSFIVTTGIGRAQLTMPTFEHYIFVLPLAVGRQQIWTTRVLGYNRTTSDASPDPTNVTDVLVGQDIQVSCRIAFAGLRKGDHVTMQTDSYWSPNVHIRPEWWKGKMGQEEDEGH